MTNGRGTGETGQIVDEIDRALVDALRSDGRQSVNALAERIGVSRSTAYQRLGRLEETGVIRGYRAVVDPAALGRDVAALLLLEIDQHDWRAVLDDVRSIDGLEYLAFTSGEFDMVLLVRVPDVHTLRDVVLDHLHGLARIRTTRTVFVLDDWVPDGGPPFASSL